MPDGYTYSRRLKDSIKNSEAMMWFFDNGVAGGNGVFRFGSSPTQSLAVTQTDPPSMRVLVAEGGAIVNSKPVRLPTGGSITIPGITEQVRWDLICINYDGKLQVVQGINGTAVDPDVTVNVEKLFRVVHQVGEFTILNSSLEDIRSYAN